MNKIEIFGEPIRKPSNRGPRKIIGHFASLKSGRAWPWESQLERDYLYDPEYDKAVIEYRTQSVRINYRMNNRQRIYHPDVLEFRIEEKSMVEVKPKSRLEEYEERFSLIQEICKDNGFAFRVVTEDQIRVEPKLSNIKFLYRYARKQMPQDHFRQIMDLFGGHNGKKTLMEAEDELSPAGLNRSDIFHLIYHGYLSADMTRPLAADSEIWATA